MASDSPSATTPRTTGRRSAQCRVIGETIGFETCAISPSGLRTATDQFEGPRIMTPSRTACPPMGDDTKERFRLAPAGALEPSLETLDAAAGVDQLLLAGVEGMAVRADLDVHLGLR